MTLILEIAAGVVLGGLVLYLLPLILLAALFVAIAAVAILAVIGISSIHLDWYEVATLAGIIAFLVIGSVIVDRSS
jgi:hypothetical protein